MKIQILSFGYKSVDFLQTKTKMLPRLFYGNNQIHFNSRNWFFSIFLFVCPSVSHMLQFV